MTAYNTTQRDYYWRKHDRTKLDPELYVATLDGVRTPEQDLIEGQEWQHFKHLINQLNPPRLGLAFCYRCGIGCKPMAYKKIAEKFGCSTARAQQIVQKAVRILQHKILLEKNPRLLRNIIAEEEAIEHAKKRADRQRNAKKYAAGRTHDDIEIEARREADREKRAKYLEECERASFDEAYDEAHALNSQWGKEVKRRKRVIRQQYNAKKRDEAFQLQAKDLKDAHEAYYASIGTPAEHYCYIIYNDRMKEWGPVQDRIWRDFPYD